MNILHLLIQILVTAFTMFWVVLWPLILGFTLSAIVQALVSHKTLAKTLGNDTPRSLTIASLFGIASSSCSYAAVALSRSLFQKGASFTSAMVFELASTNLVIELGIILIVLMGWQFMAAEYAGGISMVVLIALIFRFTLTNQLVSSAKKHMAQGRHGKMEGHAVMDMSIQKVKGQKLQGKIAAAVIAISNYFVMDIAAIWVDVVVGFVIAGTLTILVPHSFWQVFFQTGHPTVSFIIGPLIGPLVAIISFVCSVGNVPLAAVLWQGGISFGGVVSFIFADLIILPILDIYRKYYGWKVMSYILITFYFAMIAAGYLVEIIFSLLHILPTNRNITVITEGISWNYTTWLNFVFIIVLAILVYTFIRNDGLPMLKMMDTEEHVHH